MVFALTSTTLSAVAFNSRDDAAAAAAAAEVAEEEETFPTSQSSGVGGVCGVSGIFGVSGDLDFTEGVMRQLGDRMQSSKDFHKSSALSSPSHCSSPK